MRTVRIVVVIGVVVAAVVALLVFRSFKRDTVQFRASAPEIRMVGPTIPGIPD